MKTKKEIAIAFYKRASINLIALLVFGWGLYTICALAYWADHLTVNYKAPQHRVWYTFTATGYSADANQTDNTPCISANGTDICQKYYSNQCVVAANDLPMGSVIEIKGIGACQVLDRLNSRFNGHNKIDIFFGANTKQAKEYGVKKVLIRL